MPARLDTLRDKDIGARAYRLGRLLGCGHGDPDLAAGGPQPVDHGRGRAAERERHDGYPALLDERELVRPAVVVEARAAELHAVPVGLAGEQVDVGRDPVGVARGARHEDVHPVGPRGQSGEPVECRPERVRAQVPGREEAEPARLADRGREFGC